uniref:N-acylglucosamine 2-epimerase isoform X1 n=1 Tax=Doryrhamphus excisus TaxID=161450 RepID=UPI0025ADF9AF|nr:N-acylglucosamine 2-epimerase isoform X1 [Doryrhamphus excisus]
MYSTRRDDRAAQRGTGVFYQAIPGVGSDGKKIMTLIPVQLVNGKFVHTQIVKPQTHPPACKFIPVAGAAAPIPGGRKAALTSLPTKQPGNAQVPFVNALPDALGTANQGLALGMSSNTYSRRIVVQKVLPRVLVRAAPASEPASPSANTLSCSTRRTNGLSMTTQQSSALKNNSEAEYICSTPPKTSPSLGVSKADLRLTPKVSHSSNSPMKWVIEEVNSNELSLDHSHSVHLKPVQTAKKGNENMEVVERVKPVSPTLLTRSSSSENDHRKELIMCDGRLFFAAKKCSFSLPKGSKETVSPTAEAKAPVVVSEAPHEVIDLCNDDNEEDSCQTTRLTASLDEDNVIFVSYIPPKSESTPTQCLVPESLENETTRNLRSVTEHNKTTLSSDTVHDQLTCESPNTRVTALTDSNMDAVINSQRSTEQQSDNLQLSLEMTSLSDSSISDRNEGEATDKLKMSTNALTVNRSSPTNQMTDLHIRKIFGIIADVKICLQRINPASSEAGSKEPRRPTNPLKDKELHVQYCYTPQGPDSTSVKKTKRSADGILPGVIVTLSPHAHYLDTEPLVGLVEPIDDDDLSSIEENNSQDSDIQTLNSIPTNTSRMGRARKRTMCPCCVPGSSGRTAKSSLRVEEPERLPWTKDHMSKSGGRQQKLKSNKRM